MPGRTFLILLLMLFSFEVFASIDLPKNLTAGERERFLRIFGLGFAPTLSSYLVPLGGSEGAEVTLDYQTVQTREVSQLGARSKAQPYTSIMGLTFAKGIFYNIDLSFSFNPGLQDENLKSYAAHGRWISDLRWDWPATFGFNIFAHGLQIQDKVSSRTVGFDFFAVYYIDSLSIQAGVGSARIIGSFTGGADGVTDTGQNEPADVMAYRWFAGLGGRSGRLIWGAEAAQYENLTLSGRIGFRF